MKRVVFNKKGGVGKSSIVCNLAAISAESGMKTLVIDLDSQANATHYLTGNDPDSHKTSISDLFENSLSFNIFGKSTVDFIQKTPFDNLDIIPASIKLEEIIYKLESKHKIYKLRDAVEELYGTYKNIYIDTPPAFNFYTRSALIAADSCLIPFDCDVFSREAMVNIIDDINELREDHNRNLVVEGIIVNQYQPTAKLPNQLIEILIDEGYPVLPNYLNQSVKMRESHSLSKPLIYFAANHKLTKQYLQLYFSLEKEREIA